MCRALAGKILTFLTCMPAGDSKNEHGNTHCSHRRQDSIAQRDAAAPLQRLSARAAKERQEKTTIKIQMVFSFPSEERVTFSQPRKDDGARVATAQGRLLSSSGCVGWDNTTIKKEQ